MAKNLSLYLDACCLNRLFDDWSQARIRLEGEAVLEILGRCQLTDWQLVSSFALTAEIRRTPSRDRQEQVLAALEMAAFTIESTPAIIDRAQALVRQGIKNFDALHLACAEHGQISVFLTTDDRLLRRAKTLMLNVLVENPVTWLLQSRSFNGEKP
ncbi:MAG: type II toxin-antitoxin system VapC family toxin [Spirulina sp. SIO3F2]|nr:type II toxin-antitoxin system VapC family toxin [Spirulina sp. SIO3F2]